MKRFEKLILPVALILSSLILGSFYLATEYVKGTFVEKQSNLELEKLKTEEMFKASEIATEKQERESCYIEAEEKARSLAKTKASFSDGAFYKEGADAGLYLRSDFDSYYEDCLSKYGLER